MADKTAFTASPITDKNPNASGWSWSWALGIPASTQKADAAKKFLAWATSKDYAKLVGESEGWVSAPPGTRASTYANPDYIKAAPFADTVLKAIQVADPAHPTVNPVPYTGRAVRRDSGIPGDRHAGRAGDRGGSRRIPDGRPSAREGAGGDRARHEGRRLSEVKRRGEAAGAASPSLRGLLTRVSFGSMARTSNPDPNIRFSRVEIRTVRA